MVEDNSVSDVWYLIGITWTLLWLASFIILITTGNLNDTTISIWWICFPLGVPIFIVFTMKIFKAFVKDYIDTYRRIRNR